MKLPISKGRARLFELAELVRSAGDDTVVVLEHRDGGEGVALVREARLAYLEDRVMQIDKQADKPFTLAGSLSSELDDRALLGVLKELRQAWGGVPAARPAPRRSPRKP